MADSTTHLDTISQSGASQDQLANALYDALSPAALFGRRASQCTGLTWAYFGGNVTKSDGSQVTVGNGSVTATASSTNYVTALKESGAVYCHTTTTAWDDTANYWRLYSLTAGASSITSFTDEREIGRMTGLGTGPVAPVIKTGNFTFGANENEVICNGSASITATLPAASSWVGRKIRIKTIAAFTVVSASSNVKPLDTNTAGTAILAATAGKWAELVSDGTNWVEMAGN